MKEFTEYKHENQRSDETEESGWKSEWVTGKLYKFDNADEIIKWIQDENIQDDFIVHICRDDNGIKKLGWLLYCDEVKTCQQ